MNQLSKLQHTFQDCVLAPNNQNSTTWVSAGGRADPDTQLSIYSYAYAARLREVLATDFPAVAMALGDDLFDTLMNNYIAAHPSKYFSLREFGDHLPVFISNLIQTSANYQGMDWLHELAIFEWTLGQAFDAADTPLFTEQDMANISPEAWPELKFIVHPSVYRLDFKWNTPELWKALTDDNPKQITAEQDSSSWLIWRHQLTTRFRSMHTDEQLALDKLREGADFNSVCETLTVLMNDDEIPMHAATLLKGWITQDLIAGILD